jgi:hypothetical protein
MVEREHHVVEAQHDRFILRDRSFAATQAVELPAEFIRNGTDHAALKRRQVRDGLQRKTLEQVAQNSHRSAWNRRAIPGRAPANRRERAKRLQPDEGIAPELRLEHGAIQKGESGPHGEQPRDLERLPPPQVVGPQSVQLGRHVISHRIRQHLPTILSGKLKSCRDM